MNSLWGERGEGVGGIIMDCSSTFISISSCAISTVVYIYIYIILKFSDLLPLMCSIYITVTTVLVYDRYIHPVHHTNLERRSTLHSVRNIRFIVVLLKSKVLAVYR